MTNGVTKIENLVFEGGGVRGIAYAGAIKALQERGFLESVERVAGASAGAFTALLLSLGNTPDQVKEVLSNLHFKTLEDKPNPLRIATHYGLYKGEVLYAWIVEQLTNKGLPEDLSFEALRKQGARDLHVFATDLNLRNTREFSAETTPLASVAGAVRASMSIPLMYSAWQFPNGVPDDHVYVDGGTVYNYPINAFDNKLGINPNTLGFCFTGASDKPAASSLGKDHLFEFTRSLFATILSTQVIDFERNLAEKARSVQIDDLGYKATDLDITDEGFELLFRSGYDATQAYLSQLQRI
ncbi:MAG: patatin-like phospholipase family protein [Kordiimonas sp.]